MKPAVKKVFAGLGIALLLGMGTWAYFFAGPFRFKEHPISAQRLAWVQAGSSPVQATYDYLHGTWPSSDRPKCEYLEIEVNETGASQTIVRVINHHTLDDSTSRTCDQLTLQRQNSVWTPIRHQAAWQGRGRIGWTTRPTF